MAQFGRGGAGPPAFAEASADWYCWPPEALAEEAGPAGLRVAADLRAAECDVAS